MSWLVWASIAPMCVVGVWLIVRGPVSHHLERTQAERSRLLFRQQRERLEARFVSALSELDPIEGERWDEAIWHDGVLWARDRQTRRLLALIEVHFPRGVLDDLAGIEPRHSTALFEFHKGCWQAEGKRLDEVRPEEAMLSNRRFEPVTPPVRPH